MKTKKAIILVAGLGIRLKPLTNEVPKCLTEVNGKPILFNTLEILEKNGIEEAVLVVGYLWGKIVRKVGYKYKNMKLSYVFNNDFKNTNTMYSLWLARKDLEEGAILIEGDTYFEEDMIHGVLETTDEIRAYETLWLGQHFTHEYKGSMLTTDEKNKITNIQITLGEFEYKENYYKSTGIIKISPEYGKLLSKWLTEEVKEGNTNIYYDMVIAKHLEEHPIFVHDITSHNWVEIDSVEDINKAEKIFTPTKHVIIVLDGAGDITYPELDNKTPLEVAETPNIDYLAKKGMTGLMKTIYSPLPIGSIVAMLGILGYNPLRYYPNGRASFEALAHDIYMNEGDIAFRCNLVSLNTKIPKGILLNSIKKNYDTCDLYLEPRWKILSDFTADNISDYFSKKIINAIHSFYSSRYEEIEFHLGQGYRNFCIYRDAKINPGDIIAKEPHTNIGKPISELLLRGKTTESSRLAEGLNRVILKSIRQLKDFHPELETKADMLYFWSPSSEPRLTSFHKRFGIDGAVIAGVDFLRGIGIACRMEAKKIPGATGDTNTNLQEKLKYAINSLKYNDLVFLHINALDEISHRKDLNEKIKFLEKIDKEIVEPLKNLDTIYEKFKIAIVVDHYTTCKDGKHTDDLVPFLIYGDAVDDVETFSERSIEGKNITKSYEFMDLFLGG